MSAPFGSRSGVYQLGTPVDIDAIRGPATIDDIIEDGRFEMQPFAVVVPDREIESKEQFAALIEDPNPESLVAKTCFVDVETYDGDVVLVAIKKTAAFYVHISRVFIMNVDHHRMFMPSNTNVQKIFKHGH